MRTPLRTTVRRGAASALLVAALTSSTVIPHGTAAALAADSAPAAVDRAAVDQAAVTPPLSVVSPTVSNLGGWGVTGRDLSTSPLADFKSTVAAITQWNDRIYVGGVFTAVARNGVTQAAQPYLAAFDRATGAWVSTFRPVLNGSVWDLAVTPKGQLLVAGYFSSVDGVAAGGVVALDPATGSVDPTFTVAVQNTIAGATRAGVRTMDVVGNWVYIGGHVTVVTGGQGAQASTARGRNLFRLALDTGRPDGNFKPSLSTAPFQVYASRLGDRVYAAGKFGTVNGVTKAVAAVFSATNGQLVPGVADVKPSYNRRSTTYAPYGQAIMETADGKRVVVAPTEHSLQLLGRDAFAVLYGHITGGTAARSGGGDFQAITETNGVVYAACHCWTNDYANAYTLPNPGSAPSSYSSSTRVHGILAFDAATLKLLSFYPSAYGDYGDSAWQLFVDSTGCLWAGGDYTHAPGQWLGGFAKFCPATP